MLYFEAAGIPLCRVLSVQRSVSGEAGPVFTGKTSSLFICVWNVVSENTHHKAKTTATIRVGQVSG